MKVTHWSLNSGPRSPGFLGNVGSVAGSAWSHVISKLDDKWKDAHVLVWDDHEYIQLMMTLWYTSLVGPEPTPFIPLNPAVDDQLLRRNSIVAGMNQQERKKKKRERNNKTIGVESSFFQSNLRLALLPTTCFYLSLLRDPTFTCGKPKGWKNSRYQAPRIVNFNTREERMVVSHGLIGGQL